MRVKVTNKIVSLKIPAKLSSMKMGKKTRESNNDLIRQLSLELKKVIVDC